MASIINVDVCLFDLDGTIVDTTVAAESAWTKLCTEHKVNPQELFKVSHGSKSAEMFKLFFPNVDNTDNKATLALEKDMADSYLEHVHLVPGARHLLQALDHDPTDPSVNFKEGERRKWAIVTSGNHYLAYSWFKTILKDVGPPSVFVTGADVSRGKPDPMGYTMARDKISKVRNYKIPCRSVVFEDAPVGIMAGNAMGATTVAIASSFTKEELLEAHPDYIVQDLTHVTVLKNTETGCVSLKITDPLYKA